MKRNGKRHFMAFFSKVLEWEAPCYPFAFVKLGYQLLNLFFCDDSVWKIISLNFWRRALRYLVSIEFSSAEAVEDIMKPSLRKTCVFSKKSLYSSRESQCSFIRNNASFDSLGIQWSIVVRRGERLPLKNNKSGKSNENYCQILVDDYQCRLLGISAFIMASSVKLTHQQMESNTTIVCSRRSLTFDSAIFLYLVPRAWKFPDCVVCAVGVYSPHFHWDKINK